MFLFSSADVGRDADFQGPDQICRIGSGPPESASRPTFGSASSREPLELHAAAHPRLGVYVWSISGRSGVGSGSLHAHVGVDLGSISGRLGSVWGRFGVEFESTLTVLEAISCRFGGGVEAIWESFQGRCWGPLGVDFGRCRFDLRSKLCRSGVNLG